MNVAVLVTSTFFCLRQSGMPEEKKHPEEPGVVIS